MFLSTGWRIAKLGRRCLTTVLSLAIVLVPPSPIATVVTVVTIVTVPAAAGAVEGSDHVLGGEPDDGVDHPALLRHEPALRPATRALPVAVRPELGTSRLERGQAPLDRLEPLEDPFGGVVFHRTTIARNGLGS